MITTLRSLFGTLRAAVKWAAHHAVAAAHRAKLAAGRAAAVVTERIRRWHEQYGSDEAVAARTARRSARSAARRHFWQRAGDAAKWFQPQPVAGGRQSAVRQTVRTGPAAADQLASTGCGERKTVLVAWKGGNRNGYHEVELICAGEPDKDANCEHSAWRAVFCPCGQWLDRPWDGPCVHMAEAERTA